VMSWKGFEKNWRLPEMIKDCPFAALGRKVSYFLGLRTLQSPSTSPLVQPSV